MPRRLAAIAVLTLATAAHAAPFQNGSFDIGAPATFVFDIPAGSTQIPGWTVSAGSVDWITVNWVPSNGTSSLDMVGSLGVGGVEQTFDTVPGTTYIVAFDLAGNPGGLPVVKPLTVTVGGVSNSFTFDTTGRSGSAMGWTRQSFTFVATGATAKISFVSDVRGQGGSNNAGAALDNVTITPQAAAGPAAPIPLPWAHVGAALLVLLGATGLARRRKR
jgi:choice-of-anchor C domain-containing protein